MAKRRHAIGKMKRTHSPKTKKRLAVKRAMIDAKKAKKGSK